MALGRVRPSLERKEADCAFSRQLEERHERLRRPTWRNEAKPASRRLLDRAFALLRLDRVSSTRRPPTAALGPLRRGSAPLAATGRRAAEPRVAYPSPQRSGPNRSWRTSARVVILQAPFAGSSSPPRGVRGAPSVPHRPTRRRCPTGGLPQDKPVRLLECPIPRPHSRRPIALPTSRGTTLAAAAPRAAQSVGLFAGGRG